MRLRRTFSRKISLMNEGNVEGQVGCHRRLVQAYLYKSLLGHVWLSLIESFSKEFPITLEMTPNNTLCLSFEPPQMSLFAVEYESVISVSDSIQSLYLYLYQRVRSIVLCDSRHARQTECFSSTYHSQGRWRNHTSFFIKESAKELTSQH